MRRPQYFAFIVAFCLQCQCSGDGTTQSARRALEQVDASASETEPASLPGGRVRTAPLPQTAGRSAVGVLLEQESQCAREGATRGLGCLSDEGRAQVLRSAQREQGARVIIQGEQESRSVTRQQSEGLHALAHLAAGPLVVTWNDVKGAPATIENLYVARPGRSPREVWTEFVGENFNTLAKIWGFNSTDDLTLTGETSSGEDAVVLHGVRRRDGLPVDGEFIEAYVTNARSRLGSGVLYRLNVVVDGQSVDMPIEPRSRWLTEAQASEIADQQRRQETQRDGTQRPLMPGRGATLWLSCRHHCRPYWSISYIDGWRVDVDALSAATISAHRQTNFIGPLLMPGRPPGSTSTQAIRFRGANVVDSSGTSVGETNPDTGEHTLTANASYQIGLEGPVGSSNPWRVGRVERQVWNGSAWVAVPYRRAWNPAVEPSRNFSSPNVWSADSSGTQATALLYGWFTYWQSLFRTGAFAEVTERLVFLLSPNNATGGVFCGNTATNNFGFPTPDPNGSATWSTIACGYPTSDDVNANFPTDGDSIVTASHEFAHTVNNCAAESGTGCANRNPVNMPLYERPPISSWRPAIHGSETEVATQAISNILTRFGYANGRDGIPWNTNWTYASYDSTQDDFGTATQSAPNPLQAPCPTDYTCPSGTLCVQTDQNWYRVGNTGGLCAPTCQFDWDCPRGLNCYGNMTILPSGSGGVCWYNSYRNKFWDTVGARLAYTTGWRDALSLTLSAAGGQSYNATRDLVLGADSYYSRYLASSFTRYEVTRAIRSVYSGGSLTYYDDFTDYDTRAAVVPVRQTGWTPIWWGNGLYEYPKFEDSSDADVMLFFGLAGSSYQAESWFMDASGSPGMWIYRLDDPTVMWSSSTGSLTTGALPSTGWYVAYFWGAFGTQRWQGRIRLASGSDDGAADAAEALPMPHGAEIDATTTPGDADAYQIYVPTVGTSLEIRVTGLSSGTITLYFPTGGIYGTFSITSTPTNWLISSLPLAGHWTWKVTGASSAPYSTVAWLGCGTGAFACDYAPVTRSARYSWGDRFAGRLPGSLLYHDYEVSLQEGDFVSATITDASSTCSAEIEVYAPTQQRYFENQAVMIWRDGAATRDASGSAQGVGGALQAITSGTYRFRVRPAQGLSCPFYRIHLAKAGPSRSASPMPAW